MRLKDYPRPKGDTGIGFHWFPDYRHYEARHLEAFLPLLQRLRASWLVLPSHPYESIPEHFIRGLVEQDIEPVIDLAIPYISFLDQEKLRLICERYASWGVDYISLFREPNLAKRWPQWKEEGLAARFMDLLVPCLETMHQVEGIIPLFPPLYPGGDYWDTLFLAECFDILNQRGKGELYDKMAVGLENFAFNRPLTWGRGGPARWPSAQPHLTPPGCEDQRGFHQFDWYDQIIRQKVGRSLPLLGLANGVALGDQADPNLPPIDEEAHAERSVEISQMMMRGEVPNAFFNNAFWLLVAEEASPYAQQRWFRPDGQPALPQSVEALQGMATTPRRFQVQVPERVRVLSGDSVVVMELEEYLRGVLPREMGWEAPLEALKAQAVAARTYAARAVEYPRHREKGADLCTTTHCQVWSPTHHQRTDQAVEETAGVVATYDNEIIGAFYFGHCDGHTRNSEEVWRLALPYCRSVECICGYQERYGHGVGMCQRGAMAMAEKGATYQEILTHYYTGIEVTKGGRAYGLPAIAWPAPRSSLELWEWPRPPKDNGLGIHVGLNFGQEALAQDLARVKDLGLKWVLLVPQDELQLERAVKLFWAEGIMPVVRPYALIDRSHNFARDVDIMSRNAIPPYIQIYNEPRDGREWTSGKPDIPLFVRKWVDKALSVYEEGGYPGLQVLDLDLLRQVIAETKVREVTHLWGRAWFCPHNYGLNHPPNYPYDAVNQRGIPVQHPEWEFVAPIEEVNRWREEDKNPGQTVHDDYNCVLGFLAFARVFQEELGFVPPMICGEGGWQYGSAQDRRYAKVSDYFHAQYHRRLFAWFKEGRLSNGEPLPDYLFAVCPWILSGPDADAWYSTITGTREETISSIKGLGSFTRKPPAPQPPPEESTAWEMSVERMDRPGSRGLAGKFPRAGIRLTISDPWGNGVVVVSGSRTEHGPGGFETTVWADGVYTLRFLDQAFQVRIQGDFLFLTFTEVSSEETKQARLASGWMGREEAKELLEDLEGAYEGLFSLDQR